MSTAADVQARVTAQAEELTREEHLIDLEHPDPERRPSVWSSPCS